MKKQIQFFLMLALVGATFAAVAQAQTGGNYTITQSVIANGGGTSASAGNTYQVEGTIGQAMAGVTSTGANYSVKSGFWTSQLSPSAATVSIGGRVMVGGANGKGIINVRVSVTDAGGTTRSVLTGIGGKYRFDDLEAGQIYIFTVAAKRYTFDLPTVVHSATENFDELNFVGTLQF